MPPMTPVPVEWRAPAPAPVEIASGSTPRMNASEVIRIGRKRSRAASMRGGRRRQSFVVLDHRELDDQDRVLRGQAKQRHQADLEIDVVGDSAQPDRGERAEGAEGQRQQHRQRERQLLVLRGKDEEHHDDGEPQREGRGAAGFLLLVRRAAPVVAEIGRQRFAWRSARCARSPGPSSHPAHPMPRILTAGRLLKRSSASGPDE